MSKVTKILYAKTEEIERIQALCSVAGFLRADIWRRYGGLGTIAKTASCIRKQITAKKYYADLPIDGTVRAETTKDIINDIYLYKESAKEKVRKEINKRTNDKKEQRKLYKLLKSDNYLKNRVTSHNLQVNVKILKL